MRPEECVVPEDAARAVVEQYEGLPGCRDLEQAAEHLAANALYQIETQKIDGVTFGVGDVRRILSM
jgi:ATP-dependent Lon protease